GVHGPESERRHVLADLLGEEPEEVHDVVGAAGEALAKLRILRGDADGAGVEMADAHHDAAQDDERRRREAVLLAAEQRRDEDVASGLHLAVDLDHDAVAKLVQHQDLLRLGQAQLPRHAALLDRGEGRGEGAVPPAGPEISTTSEKAFATPAATVPTPISATSFTCTRASGLAFFRSWISCLMSSIE